MSDETREAWLNAAVEGLRPWFSEFGAELSGPLRVSIGFPSRGALSAKRRRIGECWAPSASGDGTTELLISPLLDDPTEVLGVLTHELCHAQLGVKVGHRAPFVRLARLLLLDGPATATVPSEAFRQRAEPLLRQLGPLPHSRLTVEQVLRGRKPDSCRQLKAECPACGYLVRVTKKWLDAAGAPICPTDARPLVCEGVGESADP